MKIREILGRKGRHVVTISPEESVLAAARTLVGHDIGSLVVTDGPRPQGIITERDILRLTAREPARLPDTAVGEVMTTDLVVADLDDELEEAMTVMTDRRLRHLPVVEDRALAGIVSIGDLVNACLARVEDENEHLRRYIQGVG